MVESQYNRVQSHQNFDPSPTVTTGKPPDPTFVPFQTVFQPLGVKQIFHHPNQLKTYHPARNFIANPAVTMGIHQDPENGAEIAVLEI